ncbi:MAG: copper resistance protein NlpE [Chryseobacterium sp.]|nr:MAG: copper resistance protein NlpE [Chryseobacterium sp.]
MKKTLLIFGTALALAACKKNETTTVSTTQPADTGNVVAGQTGMDATIPEGVEANATGTYEGILPCASCPGIDTKLELNNDMTYELEQEYQGEKGNKFTEKGRYAYDAATKVVTLQGGDQEHYYRVGTNTLTQLNTDKTEVTGELAGHYILTKQ